MVETTHTSPARSDGRDERATAAARAAAAQRRRRRRRRAPDDDDDDARRRRRRRRRKCPPARRGRSEASRDAPLPREAVHGVVARGAHPRGRYVERAARRRGGEDEVQGETLGEARAAADRTPRRGRAALVPRVLGSQQRRRRECARRRRRRRRDDDDDDPRPVADATHRGVARVASRLRLPGREGERGRVVLGRRPRRDRATPGVAAGVRQQ